MHSLSATVSIIFQLSSKSGFEPGLHGLYLSTETQRGCKNSSEGPLPSPRSSLWSIVLSAQPLASLDCCSGCPPVHIDPDVPAWPRYWHHNRAQSDQQDIARHVAISHKANSQCFTMRNKHGFAAKVFQLACEANVSAAQESGRGCHGHFTSPLRCLPVHRYQP